MDLDEGGHPARPLVVCPGRAVTTAFYVDDSMLGTLTTIPVRARPNPSEPDVGAVDDRDPPKQPGLYVSAGVVVEAVRVEGDETLIRLDQSTFRATGLVPSNTLGKAFHFQSTWRRPRGTAVEVGARVRFFASAEADGIEIGEMTSDGGDLVVALSTHASGRRLVAAQSYGGATMIGWVDERDVRARELDAPGWGRSGVDGPVDPRALRPNERLEHPVTLLPDTVLRPSTVDVPVGLVTAQHSFHCLDACDSPAPVVEVSTCLGRIALVATRTSPHQAP